MDNKVENFIDSDFKQEIDFTMSIDNKKCKIDLDADTYELIRNILIRQNNL